MGDLWMGVQSGAWHVYVSAARDATLADHGRGNTFQKVKSERRVKPKKSKREQSQQASVRSDVLLVQISPRTHQI